MVDQEENKQDSKFIKFEELDTQDDGFLSGMGFGMDKKEEEELEQEPQEEKEKEDDIFDLQKQVSSNTFYPQKKPFAKSKSDKKPGFKPKDKPQNKFASKTKEKPQTKFADKSKPKFANKHKDKFSNKAKSFGTVLETPKQTTKKTVKEEAKTSSTLKKKMEIMLSDNVTVKEFAEKMGVPLPEVMKKLLMNKIVLPANASIDFDTATLIADEFDVKIVKQDTSVSVQDIMEGNLDTILAQDKEAENLESRPPIVTIMGHVDHGKTKLLDYIRKTTVVDKEVGGITQSIGASQAIHDDKLITFIDTPGHELFTALRARGSKITDIVIIVIAADEGIKPQTVEAINHAKDSGVPIIVAITKIDKKEANPEIIKSQMSEHGLIPEERGGEVPIVKLSSITGEGVDDLLEMIVLQAEMLELTYNPHRGGVGVVLEANKDSKTGVMTSLILMTGTLSVGDVVVIHDTSGKVRKMVDRKGDDIKLLQGGDPAMILGIQDLPRPGAIVEVVKSEKEAHAKTNLIKQKESSQSKQATLQNMLDKISQGENVQVKLILKADSFGSLEAFKYAIGKIEMPENIELKIVHSDVGAITDSDIVLADAAGAVVIGYNVGAIASLKKKAENLNVAIKTFDIIYEVLDYVDRLAKGMVKVEEKEVYIGALEVLGIFYKKGKEMIIGGKVGDGKIVNGAYFKIIRDVEDTKSDDEEDNGEIGGGKILSLKKETENVNEISKGHECGMKVKVNKKIQEGDILEFYVIE